MAESFLKEIFYPLNQGDAGMNWLQFGNGIRNEMKCLYSQLNQLPPHNRPRIFFYLHRLHNNLIYHPRINHTQESSMHPIHVSYYDSNQPHSSYFLRRPHARINQTN